MHRKSYQAPHRRAGAGILLVLLLALPLASALADDPEYGCLAAAKRALTAGKSSRPVAEGTIHYDVREYRLTVDLDPAETEYTGEVYVRFAPQLQDFTDFVLDVVDLEILSVTGGDGPLPFVQAGDSLVVTLPLTKVGADDSVTVAYRGELGLRNQEGLGHWPANPDTLGNTGPCVSTFSEPEFSRFWWPCKDRPYDKATATITITAPDDLTAVSNGVLADEVDNGDGTKTWTWVESHPIAPYLVSVAVSEYDHLAETCFTDDSTVSLDHWVFPPSHDDAVTDFTPLCDMLEFMEDLVGPFPFADEKYGHAQYLNTLSGAMEHQTITSYGTNLIRGDNHYDWIVVHELAHQWFGDSLTPEAWPDIWLNEGFASYSEALWREHLYGMDGDGVHSGYWWKMRYIRWENDWIGQTTVYDPFPILSKVVYDKGSWILHMLRGRMGDAPFFALLNDWATGSDRPEGVVATDEFIELASAHAGEDLAAFFDPWLNENTVPHLEIATSVEGGFGTSTELTVRLTDRSGVAFDNKYPLLVVTDAGDEWRTIRLVGAEHTEIFGFSSPVQSAQLDPQGWVAWRSVAEAPTALRLLRAVPNPSFNGVVGLVYRLEHDDEVSLEIYDVRGRRIFERDLGPVLGNFGDQEALWAGKDDDGRPVSSGVYWARLEAGGESSVLKFSVVR